MAADRFSSKPPSFATLAKRMSSWTTNSLLTLLILLGGLGFGRQVLKWWAAEPASSGGAPVASFGDGLGDPMQLHTIQFGDSSWTLRRQSIVGDESSAIGQLRAACREVLKTRVPSNQNSRPPLETEQAATKSPLPSENGKGTKGEGEDKFLALLSDSTPVEEEGKWRIYEFHEAFPMAVGLTRSGTAAATEPAKTSVNLAQAGYRVVVWAVAVPSTNGEWTLYSFQPESPSIEVVSGLAEIPFPEGCHRGLSLRAAEGAGLIAFSGPERPQQWKLFYDNWFRRQGWQTMTDWQPVGPAWYAKFVAKDGGGAVDVRFGPDGRGGLSGLMMITPPGAR
jgi:hypothetical protein